MNCIQNQITLNNKVLIRNKVAAFIITGGQDGIQAVAGQMMGFFSEIGYLLPQFPFIAHSLGWEAEDMERNVDFVRDQRGAARRRARAGGTCDRDVELPGGAPLVDTRDDPEGWAEGVGLAGEPTLHESRNALRGFALQIAEPGRDLVHLQ